MNNVGADEAVELNSVGARIKYLRTKKEWTQKELAERAGITVAALSRYENNLRRPMSDIIANIARILDTTSDYLLTGEGSIERENPTLSGAMQIIGLARQASEITPRQAEVLMKLAKEAFGD